MNIYTIYNARTNHTSMVYADSINHLIMFLRVKNIVTIDDINNNDVIVNEYVPQQTNIEIKVYIGQMIVGKTQ
ncbi:MAG: hypothetical protein QXN68_02685 [Thermoplasmata archaeon]